MEHHASLGGDRGNGSIKTLLKHSALPERKVMRSVRNRLGLGHEVPESVSLHQGLPANIQSRSALSRRG